MGRELTDEERKAVALLRRLAKKWPKTLWLFAGGSFDSKLFIMRKNVDGTRMVLPDSGMGMDPEAIVAEIDIESDGGDW